MKPRFYIFCYKGDAELLPGRIDNLRWVFPEAPIHLIDDAANPIPSDCAAGLVAQGACYEQTDFPRFGNLNGYYCIRGMLDVYAKHLKMDEVAIKTDADSLFLNREEVRKVIDSGLGFAAVHVAQYIFGGYFYMIRADVLSFVRQWLPRSGAVLQGAHEDVTIGCLAYACATMLNYPCDFLTDNRLGGRTGAFAHRFTGADRMAYINKQLDNKAIMLTLGNPGVTKEQALTAQQDVLECIRKRETEPNPEKMEQSAEDMEDGDHGAI